MLGIFSAMEIAASGLSAQRTRMNTTASNLANASTTRTAEGGPYKRVDPVFEAVMLDTLNSITPADHAVSQVRVREIVQDPRPGQLVYSPGHPDANAQGYVEYPNVNVVEEMVNLITASRAYEAGVTSIQTVENMADAALRIGS